MNRTGFLTAAAALAAGPTGIAAAQAVPGGPHMVERRADFDGSAFAATVGRDAQIRQVWQATGFNPAIWNNVKNSMNGLQFGFGYPAGAFLMVFAAHGPSSAYGYTDEVWKNYRIGEYFGLKDAVGGPIVSNVFFSERASVDVPADPDDASGMYQDTSIAMLQRRGLVYLTCHTAVEEQARGIVKKGFAPPAMSASDVAEDILTHLIPGAVVVPSMVATIAVLQAQYRYTYITLAA